MKRAIEPKKHPFFGRDDLLGKNPNRRAGNDEEPRPVRKREKDLGDSL
jgi:hypothetical protein